MADNKEEVEVVNRTYEAVEKRRGTKTRRFGSSRRESHDASGYYSRLPIIAVDEKSEPAPPDFYSVDRLFQHSSEDMSELVTNSVGLMVTSPPYFAGKEYDDAIKNFDAYIELLDSVFLETWRVLEPGAKAVVNIANIGRKPYISLVRYVCELMEKIGFLPRGEIIWIKAKGASGSTAFGSWMSARNPVLRDLHEYILVFSKGRWGRARRGESTMTKETFLRDTLSVWEFPPESARRVGHPAPFPVELPKRAIDLFSYKGDLVLDPFAGSCTTAVAAKQAGRHYVMYDICEEYLEVGRKRLAKVEAELEL